MLLTSPNFKIWLPLFHEVEHNKVPTSIFKRKCKSYLCICMKLIGSFYILGLQIELTKITKYIVLDLWRSISCKHIIHHRMLTHNQFKIYF
jgi:hypothetical protein